jgi:hypothetical protein
VLQQTMPSRRETLVRVCFLIGATVAFLTTLWVISNLWDRAAATADPTATGCVRHPRYDHGRSLSPVGPVHSRSAHIGCFRRCVVPGWSSCRLAADAPQRRALTTARTAAPASTPTPPTGPHPAASSPAAPASTPTPPTGPHPAASSPAAPASTPTPPTGSADLAKTAVATPGGRVPARAVRCTAGHSQAEPTARSPAALAPPVARGAVQVPRLAYGIPAAVTAVVTQTNSWGEIRTGATPYHSSRDAQEPLAPPGPQPQPWLPLSPGEHPLAPAPPAPTGTGQGSGGDAGGSGYSHLTALAAIVFPVVLTAPDGSCLAWSSSPILHASFIPSRLERPG